MPTLLEYFNNDFKDLSLDSTLIFTMLNQDDTKSSKNIEIKERIKQEKNSSVRVFTFYIPMNEEPLIVILELLKQIDKRIENSNKLVAYTKFTSDQEFGNFKYIYSNRIYIYTENLLVESQKLQLNEFCKIKGYFVTVRSSDYINEKMRLEKPMAFISHDSRDKEFIARRLATGLSSRLCPVWYDEFSLKVGDSLRDSIETGIKEAKKCILVLTKSYLSNPGWGKKEFNSIFTREMIMNEKIVLPIWYGVTKEEIYEYSPSLVDTFALIWPSIENKTDDQYNKDVEKLISKIHTAITM